MLMYLMPRTCCRRKSRNPVPLTISNSNNVVETLPRSSMRLPQQHVYDGRDTPDNAEDSGRWWWSVVGRGAGAARGARSLSTLDSTLDTRPSREKGEERRGKGSHHHESTRRWTMGFFTIESACSCSYFSVVCCCRARRNHCRTPTT